MSEVGRYIPDEIPFEFWKIINQSHGDPNKLNQLLQSMSSQDMINFYWNYEEAVAQIKPFYYELSSLSEDNIDEMCYWIVAQGDNIYRFIWDDPETAILNSESPLYELKSDPGLVSEVMSVFKNKFAKALPEKTHQNFV